MFIFLKLTTPSTIQYFINLKFSNTVQVLEETSTKKETRFGTSPEVLMAKTL